jgi:hypothetical protein
VGFESPSLRHFVFSDFSPQAASVVLLVELNSANKFRGVFELHGQRFLRHMKVRTDFFEKIAILLSDIQVIASRVLV